MSILAAIFRNQLYTFTISIDSSGVRTRKIWTLSSKIWRWLVDMQRLPSPSVRKIRLKVWWIPQRHARICLS